jgi:hypothetical protein
VAAGQWERCFAVVNICILPTGRTMTLTAVRAEFPVMFVLRCMTGKTIPWGSFIHSIYVTSRTLDVRVAAGQWERCFAVVNICILPTGCTMTLTAVRAELPVMFILRCMTGKTIPWCAFENIVNMTCRTRCRCMAARQGECRPAVVEANVLPAAGVMTGCAVRAKLPVVGILCGMTGKAVLRCAFVHAIHMAGSTGDSFMQSREREFGLAVIE